MSQWKMQEIIQLTILLKEKYNPPHVFGGHQNSKMRGQRNCDNQSVLEEFLPGQR